MWLLSRHARDQLDGICKKGIIPSLQGVFLPSLSKEAELAEALVNFIILSGNTLVTLPIMENWSITVLGPQAFSNLPRSPDLTQEGLFLNKQQRQ